MNQPVVPLQGKVAAIFDMDGTMIDNMAYHQKAWQEFLRRHGIELSDEEFGRRVSGKKNSEIFEIVFGRRLDGPDLARAAEEKEALYRELYAAYIREIPGLSDVIQTLQGQGLRLAIATTAPSGNRRFCLEQLHMEDKFEVILGDEDVVHGKPDPEIYLKTAEQLGVAPSECIVFEDSPSGVQSAQSAGMTVIGILSSHAVEELVGADYTVKDFTDLSFS